MKVIFLDFDGVLNDKEHSFYQQLLPQKVKCLTDFCVKENIKLVFSTNWRTNAEHNTTQMLHEVLIKNGANPLVQSLDCLKDFKSYFNDMPFHEVIAKAPYRGFEIQDWLESYHPQSYVILDDNPKILLKDPQIVLTDPFEGLMPADIPKIKTAFENQKDMVIDYKKNHTHTLLEKLLRGEKKFWKVDDLVDFTPVEKRRMRLPQ